jgi:hypothetical protein
MYIHNVLILTLFANILGHFFTNSSGHHVCKWHKNQSRLHFWRKHCIFWHNNKASGSVAKRGLLAGTTFLCLIIIGSRSFSTPTHQRRYICRCYGLMCPYVLCWEPSSRPVFNFTPGPRISPKGEVISQGWRPFGLLNIRECSPLGVNERVNNNPREKLHPKGQTNVVKNGLWLHQRQNY